MKPAYLSTSFPNPSFLPSSTPLHQRKLAFLTARMMEKKKSRELLFHTSVRHTANIHVFLAFDSPALPTNRQSVESGYGGIPTAKEMYPDINEPALMRRIDIQVVPVLCLLFVFAFLDRINIANAAVYGMNEELGLVANQYNAALTIL